MKKAIALTYTLLVLNSPALSFAQSPTSTTLRDTVKQQVQQEINQIKSSLTKKSYVGTISAKPDGTLTITNHNNQARQALVTTDAVIKLLSGKDGTPADLKVGNFVIAMGDADGAGTLTVKRLLVTQKPDTDSRQVLYATVTKISPSSISLKTPDNKEVTARLQSSTKYTGSTKLSDVKTDAKVVVVVSQSASTLTLTHLHLFP